MTENRSGCVVGTRRCSPKNLAETVNCVTRHGRHQFSELCQMVGSRSDALSRRTDGMSEDLTLRQAISISVVQEDRRIIEELARRVGGVFVRLPENTVDNADVYDALTQAVEELGQDSGVIRQILSDKHVTSDEADHAVREISETIAALVKLQAAVRLKVAAAPVAITSARIAPRAAC